MNYDEIYERWDEFEDCRVRIPGENLWAKKLPDGNYGLNNSPLHDEYRYQDIVSSTHLPPDQAESLIVYRRWKHLLPFEWDESEDEEVAAPRRKKMIEAFDGKQGGRMLVNASFFCREHGYFLVAGETSDARAWDRIQRRLSAIGIEVFKPREPNLELTLKGGDPDKVVAVACGTCHRVARSAEDASQCCSYYRCETCNKRTRRFKLKCDACSRAEADKKYEAKRVAAFNKARRVPASEYPHDHICLHFYPDEGDYTLIDEVHDELAEDHPWVWGCTPMAWPRPMMDDIMGDLLCDEFPEGAIDHLPDLNGLQSVVEEWFEKEATGPSGYFMIDTRTVVVLDPERTPERLEPPGE